MGLFSFGKKKVEEPKSKEYYPESIDRTLENDDLDGNPYDVYNGLIGFKLCKFLDTYMSFCASYIAKTFRNVLVLSNKIDNIDKKIDLLITQNNELKQRNNELEAEIEALKRR